MQVLNPSAKQESKTKIETGRKYCLPENGLSNSRISEPEEFNFGMVIGLIRKYLPDYKKQSP